MRPVWIKEARRQLLQLRRPSGAWGYRPTTSPAVEPTALAGLALRESHPEISMQAGQWLAANQHKDGSLGVSDQLSQPGWATPFASLLWAALGEFDGQRVAASRWLLATRGQANPRTKDEPMGHDLTLVGWPWTPGTHSWVEPTAMAILALNRDGKQDHSRVAEGLKLICDRAIPGSGWNLGNPVVFGTILRPVPAPTGLALLALAGNEGLSRIINPSLAYLQNALAATHAPSSLGWGLLGLRAWGAGLPNSLDWLDEAYRYCSIRNPSATDLAMLLLAAGDSSIELLGIPSREKAAAHAG